MQRLTVESERGAYNVVAEQGAVARLAELLTEEGLGKPRSVVSNTTVGPLWGRPAAESLAAPLVELADGEVHKHWASVEELLGRWLETGLHRGSSVAAVGGGVLTDTVGFAAAVYLRGVDWVAIPTTLLAMVDASVGGKTGVNLDQGKNLVGAFWAPRLVVIDVETLTTLPERELTAGMAEVIKTAWIGDHALLQRIPSDLGAVSPDRWQDLVMRCVEVKARVVAEDEREAGPRAALNLGHTLGHALEAATGYTHFLHGEAIAWGMLAAARLARRRGLLSAEGEETMGRAIATLGTLPPLRNIEEGAVRSHIVRDKKRHDDGIAWVLPTDGGIELGQHITLEEVLEVFRELQQTSDFGD